MKRYDGYDEAKEMFNTYEKLEVGGYICKIKGVEVLEKNYGHLMKVFFDICEGNKKGFYERQYKQRKERDSNAKWSGVYNQTVMSVNLNYFKTFMAAIEKSNDGYCWDWDENKLIGKKFGGIFAEEEYLNSQNEIKKIIKCRFIRSVETIRNGDFTVPDIKKVTGHDQIMHNSYTVTHDDDLPF